MTKQTWYPKASRVQDFSRAYPGSAMNPNVAVIHTTETYGWPGYGGGKTAPNMTIGPNFKTKTVEYRQHFAANRSSRALENRAGGVETNTLNAFQFELIATCDPATHAKWTKQGVKHIYMPEAPDWFLAGVADALVWLHEQWTAFPLIDGTPRGWKAYPASYGTGASQRMTFKEWNASRGIVGHQHVPENSHGDPGAFPIARLLELTKPKPEPEPDPKPEPTPEPAPVPELPTGTWWDRLIAAIVEALKRLGYTPNPTPAPTPEPEPEPSPEPGSSFWGGYGNLHAPYTFTDDWLDRAPQLAQKVRDMGVSWFIALEGHGDTRTTGGNNKVELTKARDGSMQPIYQPFLDALGPTWRVAEGEGGNHLFYDAAKYEILKSRDALMPGRRWMTGWKVRRIDSGAEFWINAAHLTAGSTSDRVADREAQGRFLAEHINPTNPVILGIDRNNSTRYDGSPWQVLEDAGLLGLRAKSPTVKHGNSPTHHGSKPGAWIDDMHTSAAVTVDSAEVVETGDLTDHEFLKARFTIPA